MNSIFYDLWMDGWMDGMLCQQWWWKCLLMSLGVQLFVCSSLFLLLFFPQKMEEENPPTAKSLIISSGPKRFSKTSATEWYHCVGAWQWASEGRDHYQGRGFIYVYGFALSFPCWTCGKLLNAAAKCKQGFAERDSSILQQEVDNETQSRETAGRKSTEIGKDMIRYQLVSLRGQKH